MHVRESRVLSSSSLLVFAAHWKRLLQSLELDLRVFDLLPMERPTICSNVAWVSPRISLKNRT